MTFIILTTLSSTIGASLCRPAWVYVVWFVRSSLESAKILSKAPALGLYTSTGVLADIEVECTDGDEDGEWDPSEALLAQYRVVKGFAFFNAILLLAYVLFLLIMCIRHHNAGRKQVWTSRVPTFPWFFFGPVKPGQSQEKRTAATSALPAPVTAAPRRAAHHNSRPTHVSRPSEQPLLADLSHLQPGESRMVYIPPPQPGANRYGAATVGRSDLSRALHHRLGLSWAVTYRATHPSQQLPPREQTLILQLMLQDELALEPREQAQADLQGPRLVQKVAYLVQVQAAPPDLEYLGRVLQKLGPGLQVWYR
ncbi:hypothetical protein RHS01_01900 [Rhizoctonia solani]|uniref:Uncharacterized protein n=1 Tax=Rhizoctonia solani TaxID=456999 RepID=A0A8H7M7X3_9AGAM|nr:hypothetical protein RHS01_01900 [Rhizoctonia solani]